MMSGKRLTNKSSALFLLWEHPLWSALFALIVYALVAGLRGSIFDQSVAAYYPYLADAFLHGRLDLRALPNTAHDLVLFNGRYYAYWPPLPAVLMMPIVAVLGKDFSDIFLTLLIGALNVGLVALLLRTACLEGVLRLNRRQRALLVIAFSLGTVHLTLAPLGRVWFTGQLVAFCFTILAFLAAMRLRGAAAFFFTGLAVAGALLTRSHLVFIGIWPAYWLLRRQIQERAAQASPLRSLTGSWALGLLPLAAAVLAMGAYNYARFGSPLEIGLDYHRMAPVFAEEYARYGAFHPHYLPTNVYYQYLYYPFPVRADFFQGGSLFLLTPVFFGAFWGLARGRPRSSVFFLLLTILMVNLPILLLMGTGWVQFGPRYTLDFTVPLLLLTGMGVRRWPLSILALLTGISAIHYLGGVVYLIKAGM
jgi:hypothetical protein